MHRASDAPLRVPTAARPGHTAARLRLGVGLPDTQSASEEQQSPPRESLSQSVWSVFSHQAAAEGDAQSVVAAASAAGCSAWFLAHAPLLLAASPRGAAALRRPLPHAGGDQASPLPRKHNARLRQTDVRCCCGGARTHDGKRCFHCLLLIPSGRPLRHIHQQQLCDQSLPLRVLTRPAGSLGLSCVGGSLSTSSTFAYSHSIQCCRWRHTSWNMQQRLRRIAQPRA